MIFRRPLANAIPRAAASENENPSFTVWAQDGGVTPNMPLLPLQAYRPATFQERGVAVPFTTPILAGTRARNGSRGHVELIVPNPSGGRGYYVLGCNAVRSLCRPTVHDSRLNQLVAGLPQVTPAFVRLAAMEVAASGLAGKPAMDSALASLDRDQQEHVLAKFALLGKLAAQIAPEEFDADAWQRAPTAELEQQAHEIVVKFAASFGERPEMLSMALGSLAEQLAPLGIAGQASSARIPRLLEHLASLQTGLAEWMQDHSNDVRCELAEMVVAAAQATTAITGTVIAAIQAMIDDAPALLRNLGKMRGRLAELSGRPEWLLDGWDLVCALWRASEGPDQQGAAITEMAQLVPVLPREVAQWGAANGEARHAAAGDSIRFDRDWRSGTATLQLTARNERLRAMAV